MEAVHPDTAKMLQKSNYEMAKQIGGGSGGGKKKKKLTVAGTFFKGIKVLNDFKSDSAFCSCFVLTL